MWVSVLLLSIFFPWNFTHVSKNRWGTQLKRKKCLLFKHEKINQTLSNDWPTYCQTRICVQFVWLSFNSFSAAFWILSFYLLQQIWVVEEISLIWGGNGGRNVNCYVNISIITFIPQGVTCSLHELSWTLIGQSVNVTLHVSIIFVFT
jgi:hypothetical protein